MWTIIGWELGGIVIDIYKVAQGYDPATPVTWIFIHAIIVIAGLWVLRKAQASRFTLPRSASINQHFGAAVSEPGR